MYILHIYILYIYHMNENMCIPHTHVYIYTVHTVPPNLPGDIALQVKLDLRAHILRTLAPPEDQGIAALRSVAAHTSFSQI
jgi:hypothetical protein